MKVESELFTGKLQITFLSHGDVEPKIMHLKTLLSNASVEDCKVLNIVGSFKH